MNYLKVPDSSIKLTDGSVVILARFPGTKWVVHYGWYDYSGRRNMGWYFCSIPAQTVIPVTSQDLQLITLVDPGDVKPKPPAPPVPPCPPHPHPPFGPVPDHGLFPCPPHPHPPRPPYPPHPHPPRPPYPPHPHPPRPAFFSKNDQYLLDAAWITLPSIKYRDALSSIMVVPDGKVVKINNVDGVTRYYAWSRSDNRWVEKFYEMDPEKLQEDYYTKEQIDEFLAALNLAVSDLAAADVVINERIDAEIAAREAADAALDAKITALDAIVAEHATLIADLQTAVTGDIDALKARVEALEEAVFNIQSIVVGANNTVLVSSDGTLKDSKVGIGDAEIGEPSTHASDKVLATEKGVVQLVEKSTPQWSEI